MIALDQGDAYPRAALLSRYHAEEPYGREERVKTLSYAGEIGNNRTEAKIGGLAVSDSSYITAGLSTDQTTSSSIPAYITVVDSLRNVYITVTNKNNFSEAGTKLIWITNYTKADREKMYAHFDIGTSAMKPYLIKITNNSFMLLWTDIQSGYVNYVLLDGNGNLVGNIQNIQAELSECMPVVSEGRVIWYSYKEDRITFYALDI